MNDQTVTRMRGKCPHPEVHAPDNSPCQWCGQDTSESHVRTLVEYAERFRFDAGNDDDCREADQLIRDLAATLRSLSVQPEVERLVEAVGALFRHNADDLDTAEIKHLARAYVTLLDAWRPKR